MWESNPAHAPSSCMVTSTALLPWMDYPSMRRIVPTCKGLHGFNGYNILKNFSHFRQSCGLILNLSYTLLWQFSSIFLYTDSVHYFFGAGWITHSITSLCFTIVYYFSICIFQGTFFAQVHGWTFCDCISSHGWEKIKSWDFKCQT